MNCASSAAQRLRDEYRALRKGGVMGPASRLFALEQNARAAFDEASGSRRLLGFTVQSVFGHFARTQDGEALSYSHGSQLFINLDQAMTSAIDCLCGLAGTGSPERLSLLLVEALDRADSSSA